MYKIFMVEDDEIIARSIREHLQAWNYDVCCVEDFSNVVAEFVRFDPQLVLMDITLPFFNGYHWCSEIRKISKVPVIFLSSAADNMNIVMAVNMGADDFIPKPFDLEVLTVKIQAMLRRSYDFAGTGSMLEHKGAILNLNETTLTYQEQKIELTKNEFRILEILMENKEKVVSRETLMTKLWESDNYVDENTLSVNVNRLRKKLEALGLEEFILTKKGIGGIVWDETLEFISEKKFRMDSGHIADDFFHVRDRRTEWRSYIRVDIWNNSLHLLFTGDRRGGFLPLL